MSICEEPMFWSENNCIQPDEIAKTGYSAGDNPAAEHENYFRRMTYLCIKELQSYLFNIADKVEFEKGENGRFYYRDTTGKLVTKITKINGILYVFAPNGALKTGWCTVDGKRYYYSPDDGNIVLGWVSYAGNDYYVTLLEGKLSNQYRTINGVHYHFDERGIASKISDQDEISE